MTCSYPNQDLAALWRLQRDELRRIQLDKLNAMLKVAADHPFYQSRITTDLLPLESLDQLSDLPLLSKQELVQQSPGVAGKIFAGPAASYTRYHQTSGTSGHPMPVLDTHDDWHWWLDCWDHVLDCGSR